jgi:uncharacterized protein
VIRLYKGKLLSHISSLDHHVINQDFIIERETIEINKPNIYFLTPHPNFDFFVNGQKITKKNIISNGDQIRWVSRDSVEEKFKLRLSQDGMELYLRIINFFDFEIWPQIIDIKDDVLLIYPIKKSLPSTAISAADVIQQVKELGIEEAYVDIHSIYREIRKQTGREILIAHGEQPEPGIDGRLDLLFQSENVTSFDEVNGTMDFKNKLKIPSVKPGDILAYYHPKVDGKPGKNLFGKTFPQKTAKDLKIQIDSSITQKNNLYSSAIFGRPTIIDGENKKILQVFNRYVHNGDVTLETGNLHFLGDIIVEGHVFDGMKVEASGDIHIMQNAYRCELIAGGSIFVHGIIASSRVYAGKDSFFFSMFYNKLSTLAEEFRKLFLIVNHLIQKYSVSKTQFSKALSLLIDTKYPKLYEKTDELIKQISNFKMPIPEKMIKIAKLLVPFQNAFAIYQVNTIEILKIISKELVDMVEMELYSRKRAEINFWTASNSQIRTSGNIQIFGEGTISCTLQAGNKIEYLGKSSSSRGDRIKAKKIYLSEVGTPMGTAVKIHATENLQAKNIFLAKITTPYWTKLIENSNQYSWDIKSSRIAD